MKYIALIEHSGESWGAHVPDLPGCVAVGPSPEWVEREIQSAVAMHLEAMRRDGDPIPEPSTRAIVVDAA